MASSYNIVSCVVENLFSNLSESAILRLLLSVDVTPHWHSPIYGAPVSLDLLLSQSRVTWSFKWHGSIIISVTRENSSFFSSLFFPPILLLLLLRAIPSEDTKRTPYYIRWIYSRSSSIHIFHYQTGINARKISFYFPRLTCNPGFFSNNLWCVVISWWHQLFIAVSCFGLCNMCELNVEFYYF